MANLIRLTLIRQFERRAVGTCRAWGDVSKREVMRPWAEWIFLLFNVSNFEDLVRIEYKKKYKMSENQAHDFYYCISLYLKVPGYSY